MCLSVKTDNVPVQKNDHDCGVFLCQTAKCVSNELILDYDECDMPLLRRQMKKELKHKKVENKLDKRSAEEPLLIHSQLSTKKTIGDKPSFQNRSGDLCWLNSSLQLTLRALDLKSSVNLFSDLGRLIDTFRTRVPKNVYDASNICSLLSHGQFEHLKS